MVKFFVILLMGMPSKGMNGVKFTYSDPYAKSVYLAGDFNNWSTDATPLKKDKDGLWYVVIPLEAGKYDYKFVVDGKWISDPDNPATEGPYGNSVIKVGEGYRVLPVTLKGNTPMNSVVVFSGKVKSFTTIDKDSSDNRYRLSGEQTDAKLIINANLKDESMLYVKLHYNTETGQDKVTHTIPFYFSRGMLTLSQRHINFRGFYNKFAVRGYTPINLIGNVNEFGDDFGRGEQGAFLRLKKVLFSNIYLLYANNINSGEDIGYVRLNKKFWKFNLGATYRINHGCSVDYQVISPDSETVDSSTYLHFNTYTDIYLYAGDLSYKGPVTAYVQFLRGNTVRRADWYDVDGTKTNWVQTSRKWPRSNFSKMRMGIEKGGIKTYFDLEQHKFDRLFKSEIGDKIAFSTLHGEFINPDSAYGISISYYSQDADSTNTTWNALFDNLEIARLAYNSYPLLGYRHRMEFSSFVSFVPVWRIYTKLAFKTARYALNQNPRSDEIDYVMKIPVKRFVLSTDIRYFHVKSSYLKVDNDFLDKYLELSYNLSRNARLLVGYGKRPLNLRDEYRARREYLTDNGITEDMLKNDFKGLGNAMVSGEDGLSSIKEVKIWAELHF